jgi:hypothetical protein
VLLALVLAAGPWPATLAQAQIGAPSGVARRPPLPLPPPPAPGPPPPPDLTQPPRPATPVAPMALIALPPSMQNLPDGGWRIGGPTGRGQPDPATTNTLAEIGRLLAAGNSGRVTVVAQVAGPAEDISLARRAALANAQEVRRLLEAGGLSGTRIDLRPMGLTAEARDIIEVLPPGIASPGLNAQAPANQAPANPGRTTPSQQAPAPR